jgi:hypothetical protein
MPKRRKPLPRGATGAFAVGRDGAPGISRSRARGDDLVTPFRGVRVTGRPGTQAQWCAAYLPRLRAGQFFSHLSAAVLWGMPLSRELESSAPVHVGALAPARPVPEEWWVTCFPPTPRFG